MASSVRGLCVGWAVSTSIGLLGCWIWVKRLCAEAYLICTAAPGTFWEGTGAGPVPSTNGYRHHHQQKVFCRGQGQAHGLQTDRRQHARCVTHVHAGAVCIPGSCLGPSHMLTHIRGQRHPTPALVLQQCPAQRSMLFLAACTRSNLAALLHPKLFVTPMHAAQGCRHCGGSSGPPAGLANPCSTQCTHPAAAEGPGRPETPASSPCYQAWRNWGAGRACSSPGRTSRGVCLPQGPCRQGCAPACRSTARSQLQVSLACTLYCLAGLRPYKACTGHAGLPIWK